MLSAGVGLSLLLLFLGAMRQVFSRFKIEFFIIFVIVMSRCCQASFQLV